MTDSTASLRLAMPDSTGPSGHRRTHSAWVDRVLWVDGGAGLVAGLFGLAARHGLASFYGLPVHLLTTTALVNLAYATFSLSLAARRVRPLWLVVALAGANAAWAVVCMTLVVRYGAEARVFGIAHLLLEGAFVLTLAIVEWRWRHALTCAAASGRTAAPPQSAF